MRSPVLLATSFGLVLLAAALVSRPADAAPDSEYERPPIRYSDTEANDPVAQLHQRIERGEAKLEFTPRLGYLPALLRELDIPASSQGLVFSRTSLQTGKISPRTPRAIYFNDDVYVGFVQDGGLLEIASVDPMLGAVFYSIDQESPDRPAADAGADANAGAGAGAPGFKPARIVRESGRCLNCHDGEVRVDIPGLKVRSVFPDVRGNAILMGGFHISTHESPLTDRWGGWYVTGSTGGQASRANTFFVRQKGLEPPKPVAGAEVGVNLTDLSDRIDTSAYLTPHSDLVALMVLEHQLEAHNRLTYATHATLRALHDEQVIATELNGDARAEAVPNASTLAQIHSACEPLVEYLFFAREAKLASPVSGTSPFASEFAARGPRDGQGRSLRQLDLRSRLFRYPLSYLVYSAAFDGLPPPAKQRVYRRLWEVLSGNDSSEPFKHLSRDDRRAILEILRETKPDLPAYWRE